MSKPSRSDARLYRRALRQGWNVPPKMRAEILRALNEIVTTKDASTTKRERTSAARAIVQASRVELDAIRLAQLALFENLAERTENLEGKTDAGLAKAAGEN